MKPQYLIAPVVCISISLAWLLHQESTITELTERITDQETTSLRNNEPSSGLLPGKKQNTTSKTNSDKWTSSAEALAKGENSPGYIKAILFMQKQLMKMSEEEIELTFENILNLKINDKAKDELKLLLLNKLTETAPDKSLDLIVSDPISSERLHNSIRHKAFSDLAKKDAGSALSWLDQQITDGQFPLKSLQPSRDPLFQLEGCLLGQLIHTNSAVAMARLQSFSEGEKKIILQSPQQWIKDGEMPLDYLTITRENLSEEDASKMIAQAWTLGRDHDLKSITASLEKLPFSKQESSAIVKDGVNDYIRYNKKDARYQTAYEWAKKQDPTNAGSSLAEAIASNAHGNTPLAETFQQTLDLSGTNQDPTISSHFVATLKKRFGKNFHRVIDTIKDPKLAKQFRTLANSTK